MNEIEIYKDILGYEGYYQVSNLGNVRSLDRTIFNKGFNANTKIKGTALLGQILNTGYRMVNLWKDNKRRKFKVHRLVGTYFILNEHNKPQINHIDGNRLNNYYLNLEWATNSENGIHSYKYLGRIGAWAGKKGVLHHSSKKVYQYSMSLKFIKKWDCQNNASRFLNGHQGNLCACVKGNRKSFLGFKWFDKRIDL